MSLLAPAATPGFRWSVSNQSGPSTTPGTSVTPGASNAEGSWTNVLAALANDVYGLLLWVTGGTTSAQIKMHLLDIGYDPAGGSSYTERVPNLQVGSSGGATGNIGHFLFVPIFIPAGATVAVRIQGNNATAGTVRVMVRAFGMPVRPEFAQKLTFAETLGTITSSRGVLVTPGVSAAEGSWVSIGTTSQAWRFILPTMQIEDATASLQVVFMDVAHGDASNKVVLAENLVYISTGTSEAMFSNAAMAVHDLWCNIPAGAEIFVRLSTHIATADSNYAVLVTGLG